MSNLNIRRLDCSDSNPKIGMLDYGTFITNVPSGSDCVYVKVKKTLGTRLKLHWTKGHCILLNLEYGTLRQIPSATRVTVLEPGLIVAPLSLDKLSKVLK